jgi:muconate cycloisomerase
MRIEQINIYNLNLPFYSEFSHALTKRIMAKNILVEIITSQSKKNGYGEGAPRLYVTGESQDTSVENVGNFIKNYSFPWELNHISEIWEFIDILPEDKKFNASICALETSLLDTYSLVNKRPLIYYLPDAFFTDTIFYGASIPLASKSRIMEMCRQIKEYKIDKLRIKVGKDIEENTEKVKMVKEIIGGKCDIRLDANGIWDYEMALAHLPMMIKTGVKVLEQPMHPENPDIIRLSKKLSGHNIILMADELACSIKDVMDIIKQGCYGMINIRLSKCGGFRRSLKMLDILRANSIAFQIGCQLGESGILSAAGRALGLVTKDAVYHDGSYDNFLLKENLTKKNVGFEIGGRAGPLLNPGIGIEVDKNKIDKLCGSERIVIYNPN